MAFVAFMVIFLGIIIFVLGITFAVDLHNRLNNEKTTDD